MQLLWAIESSSRSIKTSGTGHQMINTAICFLIGAICPLGSVAWLIAAH
jgi:hypothetical protein